MLLLIDGSGICNPFISKKEPECGDLVVHGSKVAVAVLVAVGFASSAAYVVDEMERKKPRLKYRRFMLWMQMNTSRGNVDSVRNPDVVLEE